MDSIQDRMELTLPTPPQPKTIILYVGLSLHFFPMLFA